MRLSFVKPLLSQRFSSELPPERPLTSKEAAEAAPKSLPSCDRAYASDFTLAGPLKVRHCLTTFYPW